MGQTVIIVRALYGLKSSGASWHTQLSETLYSLTLSLPLPIQTSGLGQPKNLTVLNTTNSSWFMWMIS
jgi:hypothetical protein